MIQSILVLVEREILFRLAPGLRGVVKVRSVMIGESYVPGQGMVSLMGGPIWNANLHWDQERRWGTISSTSFWPDEAQIKFVTHRPNETL